MYAALRPAFVLTALLVGLSTLFFGAKFPLAQGLLPIPCALLACLVLPSRSASLVNRRYAWLVAGVFVPLGLVLLWSLVQLLPVGQGSAIASPFWHIAPQPVAWASLSMAPAFTMAYAPYMAGLMLAAWAFYRMGIVQPQALLKVIVTLIALACIYGIVQFALGNGYVLWLPKTSYHQYLTGTFINRNTFATLAGLGMLSSLGLMLQRVGEVGSRLTTRQRFKAFWLLVLRPGWPWAVLAMVCFMAMLLTSSRAGIMASLCGVLVLFGSLAGMRESVRWPLIGMITAFFIFALVMLAALGGDLGARLLSISEDVSLRQAINAASYLLASQYALTGTGLGTYPVAFITASSPEFLSQIPGTIDHAHNTYYEWLTELGIPATLLLAVSATALLASLLVGLNIRRRAIMWPALGVATLTLVGGHALADFSLSTPAVALIVIAILMAALAQSLQRREDPQPLNLPIKSGIIAAAVLVAAISGWHTVANYHAFLAGPTLRKLEKLDPVGPGPIFVAQRELMRCIAINPWHPTCHNGLAQTHLSLATGYGVTGPRAGVGLVYLNMTRDTYLESLRHAPANPLAWYRLARIEAYLGNHAQAVTYMANSLLTGPADAITAIQRIPLMLSLLPQADADNAALFRENILAHWQWSPHPTAQQLRANPSVQQAMINILPNTEANRAQWARLMHKRLPQPAGATPLGEAPETR